ncbi:LysM peptidoglycan-binding domain-containing protein [Parvibium lacunae]|uniref:LysM peptidoglycan-binding domain-containing protein n=2 Tax=Parvibium lacunae TaxID=1888893 RepID=A0A368L9K5_9BURK|nr:LysM peptidoglycan-binding domain-containing protein [Parvibium lacunae]
MQNAALTFIHSRARWPWLLPLLSTLVACSSVSLNQAPIEERKANSTLSQPGGPKIIRLNEDKAPASPSASPSLDKAVKTDASVKPEIKPGFYEVKKGDTLYSIALENGQTYRDLAAWNNLADPNLIKIGQVLRVQPETELAGSSAGGDGSAVVAVNTVKLPGMSTSMSSGPSSSSAAVPALPAAPVAPSAPAVAGAATRTEPSGVKQPYSEAAWQKTQANPATAPSPNPAASQAAAKSQPKAESIPAALPTPTATPNVSASLPAAKVDEEAGITWAWPTAQNKITEPFQESRNKGIDIEGKLGDSVLAAADGEVTYVGNALRGYGNLVIVRHNKLYLSAYAHNDKILVKEGQTVKRGQKIAEMGKSDSESPKLHFEIRRQGKPVDPAKFLP